jgi:hypothetical protein
LLTNQRFLPCPQRALSSGLKPDTLQTFYNCDGDITEVTASVRGLYSNNEDENPNGVIATLPVDKHVDLVVMNLCVRGGTTETTIHTFVTVKNGAPTPSTAIVLRKQGENLIKYKVVIGKNGDGVLTIKADYIDIVETPVPSPAREVPAAARVDPVSVGDLATEAKLTSPQQQLCSLKQSTSNERTENGFFTMVDEFITAKNKKQFLKERAVIEVNGVREKGRTELLTMNLSDLVTSVMKGDMELSGGKDAAAPCTIHLDEGNVDYPLYSLVHIGKALWLIIGTITDQDAESAGEKPHLVALQMWEKRENMGCFSSTGLPRLTEFSSSDLNLPAEVEVVDSADSDEEEESGVRNMMLYKTWVAKLADEEGFSSKWLPDSNPKAGLPDSNPKAREEDDEQMSEEEEGDEEEDEDRIGRNRGKGGPSGSRLAAPPARRQRKGPPTAGYSRNGDLTKGVEKFEGSKDQLMSLPLWGNTFKIYCYVRASVYAGIYVCNNNNFDQSTMKFLIKKDTWMKGGYGNYEFAKKEGLRMKGELLTNGD